MRIQGSIPSLLLALGLLLPAAMAHGGGGSAWEQFRDGFISPDGRTVDAGQGKISHSEGQGYAMLLAVAHDDGPLFDKLWRWTRNNLGVRKDKLFAWQWGERPTGEWNVLDFNNATDGDILIAYALLKGGERWKNADYTARGREIVRAIRENLAVTLEGRTLLLPGYEGFNDGSGVVFNPSYIILPAYRLFAQVDDRPFWEKLQEDGRHLLAVSSVGEWGLPADWMRLDGSGVRADLGKSPYFGYGAIRVLLYLSGEKSPPYPKGLKRILAYYRREGYLPRMIDLERESVSLLPASAGFYAVYALAARRSGETVLAGRIGREADNKLLQEKDAYYSLVLYLLATEKGVFE